MLLVSHSKTELAAANSARGATSRVAIKYIAVPAAIEMGSAGSACWKTGRSARVAHLVRGRGWVEGWGGLRGRRGRGRGRGRGGAQPREHSDGTARSGGDATKRGAPHE